MNFRKYLFLTFAVFSLIFASCADMTGGAASFGGLGTAVGAPNGGSGGATAAPSARQYVTVTGTISASGAFPQEIASALQGAEDPAISKSAFPNYPDSKLQYLYYTITALKADGSWSCQLDNSDIVKASGAVSYGVNIPVTDEPVKYKVTCEAYSDAEKTTLVLKGQSELFTISRSSQTASVNFALSAIQEEGETGGVDLMVDVLSVTGGIDSATMTIGDVEIEATLNVYCYFQYSDERDNYSSGIPCGAHLARFSFVKGGEEVYAFTQVVNVFKNLSTGTWVQNGAEPYFVTTTEYDGRKTTKCVLTDALLASWTLTEFFVDASRSDDPTNANYSTQSGTFINPCVTFDAALAKLVDSSKDYTIFINGTVEGAQTIPATLKSDGSGSTNAKSLTICGANGLYTSGENKGQPKDALDADGEGSVLCVQTTVPVSIKDLRITGADDDGVTGLLIQDAGADVTLLGGTLITGNQADNGGGVYISAGSLAIKGAVISGNEATDYGGGIYNDGGSVTFYSGSIESNSAHWYGGGVFNNSGSFEMKDGACIKENSASNVSDVTLSDGGGVFVYGGSFTMSGGTISGNSTSGKGGAVYVFDGAFSVGGSVSIPYGTGNDVFLESDQTISIAASLTSTAPVATITPHEYVDGTPILSLAEPSSTTIGAERAKFSIKQQSEQLEIFDISNEGYLTNVIFSFDSAFPNGNVFGTENHEDKTYAAIKYSYLNYDSLSMNITNPFADLGWDMEFKLDGETSDPASATTLADGYHTLSATLTKGSESVTATTRVHSMIKPVKVTIGTIEVYFDTNGEGAHGGGQAYISYPPYTPHYMYIEGDPYPNEASKKKTCRTVSDNSNDWRSEGTSNSVTYRYIPDSENNFVYLTEKTSNFYFYTNMAHCTYSGLDLCQIRRTDTTTTRALSALKAIDSRYFATGDVNWDGVHVSGGGCPRGYYSFDVTLTED